ncbi:hypothetical protein I4F81_006030 [Pyropia yezoensis]|uniref:Uncharacterized protein n=1 Tax=Pyropia yezoensis TaxID=2788 RepID=A0ACC3BZS3_PYRYE|nr:hypothetical protein I4F81_006030 [Neopyropia yezoensis]
MQEVSERAWRLNARTIALAPPLQTASLISPRHPSLYIDALDQPALSSAFPFLFPFLPSCFRPPWRLSAAPPASAPAPPAWPPPPARPSSPRDSPWPPPPPPPPPPPSCPAALRWPWRSPWLPPLPSWAWHAPYPPPRRRCRSRTRPPPRRWRRWRRGRPSWAPSWTLSGGCRRSCQPTMWATSTGRERRWSPHSWVRWPRPLRALVPTRRRW